MGRKCSIKGCDSKTTNPEHRGVTYHSYPLDPKVRQNWIANTQLESDKAITKSLLVCSRHFRRTDFHAAKEGKYLLKSGTVPSIFPWGKIGSSIGSHTPEEEPSQESVEAKIEQIMAETAQLEKASASNNEFVESGSKRQSSDSSSKGSTKQSRLSLSSSAKSVSSTGSPINFVAGTQVEAQDFDGNWYLAKVQEVDNADNEVLIKFEKNAAKGKVDLGEWLPMNSSRLRVKQKATGKTPNTFTVDERVLAKWTGSGKYPAIIKEVLENNTYDVLFDDGFTKKVRGYNITKIKTPKASTSIVGTPPLKSVTSQPKTTNDNSVWPLISKSSLNMDELKLPEIPQDGEWCCYWVNDQPIGKEGFLQVGDHKKPTVIVEDWRLPANWIKHMYQRSNVLGKWDVILINPQNKRFRSKADLKQYLEELGDVYNPDIYDFSIHRRRAKDIGAYAYTSDYKRGNRLIQDSETSNTSAVNISNLAEVLATTPFPETPIASELPPAELMTEPTEPTEESSMTEPTEIMSPPMLEEGYVFVGSLKVQLVDNLFKCPQKSCNKTFRKENHLQIHVKHYHSELFKEMGDCPNMQDLASKRSLGSPVAEPLPKNQIPNQQFFAKLHQQDLIHVKHRKSQVMGSTEQAPVFISSSTSTPITETPDTPFEETTKEEITMETTVSTLNTSALNETLIEDNTTTTSRPPELVSTPVSKTMHRKGDRKSSRQRTTKKYVTASTPKIFDESLNMSESEEIRSLGNVSMAPPTKKQKLVHASPPSIDENIPVTPIVAPKRPDFIYSDGEMVKIVSMKSEEIINCLCSYPEEDGLMVQCELCLCWQHGLCNGFEKASQVPEKYVCYICKNPQRGRSSMKYLYDQDWLYNGKLPIGNYHATNPELNERFDILKRSHTISGNLLELKKFLHSLTVKINISDNKDHPKMYLWAKEWEDSVKLEDIKPDIEMKDVSVEKSSESIIETENKDNAKGNIIMPEEPINPADCRKRLLQHIKTQQSRVLVRLQEIETEVVELESVDNLPDLKSADFVQTKNALSLLIKDLEKIKTLAKINTIANDQIYLQTI